MTEDSKHMNFRDAASFYRTLQKETVACPLCDCHTYDILLQDDRYHMGLQTVSCDRCGLIFVNPRPTEEEMKAFYENEYRRFYESVEVPTPEYIAQGFFGQRAEFVVQCLKRYLDSAAHTSLLDVGCAEGTLLSLIEREFPFLATYGVEPDSSFAGYARDHTRAAIFTGTYREFTAGSRRRRFDVIVTAQVLEHILNPVDYLKALETMLTDAGLLYVEVPNIMDDRVHGLGNVHLAHVVSYDPATLRMLLRTSGFAVADLITEGLPAKSPSMAAVCRKDNSVGDLDPYPPQEEIHRKKQFFRNRTGSHCGSGRPDSFLSRCKRFAKRIGGMS